MIFLFFGISGLCTWPIWNKFFFSNNGNKSVVIFFSIWIIVGLFKIIFQQNKPAIKSKTCNHDGPSNSCPECQKAKETAALREIKKRQEERFPELKTRSTSSGKNSSTFKPN